MLVRGSMSIRASPAVTTWIGEDRVTRAVQWAGKYAITRYSIMPIIAVIMPDLEKGAMMWEALLAEGLYVNLARPPATPAGMTLLRCSLCAEHSAEQVQDVLGRFGRAGRAVGILS